MLSAVARSAAQDPHPAVVYGDTDIVDNEGRFLYHRRLQPPEKLTWKSFRQGMLVCHQSFYARSDIAKANRYDLKYRHSADVKWCIEVMKEADRRRWPWSTLIKYSPITCARGIPPSITAPP